MGAEMSAIDLFVVPTAGFKLLYGLVIIRLQRRHLVWINVTTNPTADWIARYDVSRNLIRIWVSKYEAGAFDDDAKAAELLQEQEARIAALERLVGRQALELEFLKKEMRSVRSTRSATTSVITGPPASPSRKDAD
jgi:hypothetical protein